MPSTSTRYDIEPSPEMDSTKRPAGSELEEVYEVEDRVSDETALAKLGYKQEFRRAFKPVEVFGLGFSIIGLVPGIS